MRSQNAAFYQQHFTNMIISCWIRRGMQWWVRRALLLALLGAAWAAGSGGEQCARGAVTRFSVRGGYNASGHWEGEVCVERDVQLRGRPRLLLEVETWTSLCAQLATDVLLVHATESSPATQPIRKSHGGYQEIPGFGTYKLHGKAVSWDEANNTCVSEGAHLLVLDSQEEADEIQKLINKVPKPTNWFHIGFHDKKNTKNFITVLEMSPSTTAAIQITREGYQKLPGLSSYKLHGKAISWDEANNTCVSEGAHLLVLDTQEEADEIQKLINKVPKPSDWFHIGFHDKRKTRNYFTVLGYSLLSTDYNRWYPGDPSQTTEFCGGISKKVELVDIDCSNHKVMFICEV